MIMKKNIKYIITLDNDEGGTSQVYADAKTCKKIDNYSVMINGAKVDFSYEIISVEIEQITINPPIVDSKPINKNRREIHDALFNWGRTRQFVNEIFKKS